MTNLPDPAAAGSQLRADYDALERRVETLERAFRFLARYIIGGDEGELLTGYLSEGETDR